MNQDTVRKDGIIPAGSEGFTVDTLSSFAQIESIREEWDTLHDALMPGSIHSDIDWYCTIARSVGREKAPVVFTFRRNGELVGLLAGYYHEREVALKIGYLHLGHFKAKALSTNYQCCLAREAGGLHQKIADTLQAEIANNNVRLVYVNALPIDDPLYKTLRRTPFSKGIRLAYPAARHMMMHFGKTLEETIAAKGPSVRASLRRIINKNRRPDARPVFTMRLFTRPEDMQRYFSDAEAVAKKTYQRALNVGFQSTSLHRSQVELAVKKELFRGAILYDNDKPVAFQEDYLCDTHCFNPYVGYDSTYRSNNPGTLLMVKAWEALISDTNAKVYDFGFGEGLYKSRFADMCICEGELLLFAKTFRNVLLFVLLSFDLWIDMSLKRLLNTIGIYESIKKYWRRRKAGIG